MLMKKSTFGGDLLLPLHFLLWFLASYWKFLNLKQLDINNCLDMKHIWSEFVQKNLLFSGTLLQMFDKQRLSG